MVPDNHYNDLNVSVQENDNCVYHTLNSCGHTTDFLPR